MDGKRDGRRHRVLASCAYWSTFSGAKSLAFAFHLAHRRAAVAVPMRSELHSGFGRMTEGSTPIRVIQKSARCLERAPVLCLATNPKCSFRFLSSRVCKVPLGMIGVLTPAARKLRMYYVIHLPRKERLKRCQGEYSIGRCLMPSMRRGCLGAPCFMARAYLTQEVASLRITEECPQDGGDDGVF